MNIGMSETNISVKIDEQTKLAAEGVLAQHGLAPVDFLHKAMEQLTQEDYNWLVAAIAGMANERELLEVLRQVGKEATALAERSELLITTVPNVEQVKLIRQGLRRIRWVTENLEDLANTLEQLLSPTPNPDTIAALERREFVAEFTTEGKPD
jgi:hypothetical protein